MLATPSFKGTDTTKQNESYLICDYLHEWEEENGGMTAGEGYQSISEPGTLSASWSHPKPLRSHIVLHPVLSYRKPGGEDSLRSGGPLSKDWKQTLRKIGFRLLRLIATNFTALRSEIGVWQHTPNFIFLSGN